MKLESFFLVQCQSEREEKIEDALKGDDSVLDALARAYALLVVAVDVVHDVVL